MTVGVSVFSFVSLHSLTLSLSLSLLNSFDSQRQVAERNDDRSCRKRKPIPATGYYLEMI
jgi:hypothetical protein